MGIHFNTSHRVDSAAGIEVRYHPDQGHEDYRVQIFLGDSFHTLYTSVEDARAFAEQILSVLPTSVEATV